MTPERLRELATGAVLGSGFLTEETQEVAYALFAYADLLKAQATPEATGTPMPFQAMPGDESPVSQQEAVSAINHHARELARLTETWPSHEPQGPQWIQCSERIPPEDTPVLILRNGELRIGAIFTESPGHEETFKAFNYWDDPNDDGQCWEWHEVTHWMPLPSTPVTKAGS